MVARDLEHPPDGIVILPEPGDHDRYLDPRIWVDSVHRPRPRQLRERAADYLAQARELGEV